MNRSCGARNKGIEPVNELFRIDLIFRLVDRAKRMNVHQRSRGKIEQRERPSELIVIQDSEVRSVKTTERCVQRIENGQVEIWDSAVKLI